MKAQVSISFVAKPELRAALERAATAEEVSISHVIRRTLRERFITRAADRLAEEHQRHVCP